MIDRLFMLLMEGVAESARPYRVGARHALMIFATGPDLNAAHSKAVQFVSRIGWVMIELRKGTEIFDTEIIADETLRAAAESAQAHGSAIVVYQDEIRPDA